MGNPEKSWSRRPVVAATWGLVVVAAYAVAGVLQILVWNPLAAVPGATLGEIRADMARAQEPLVASWVVGWAAIGLLLAALVLIVTVVRRTIRVNLVVAMYLVLVVFAAPGHIFVAFGPGMSLADTFMISGGDHAPWGAVLYVFSAAALVTLIVLIIRTGRAAAADLAEAYARAEGERKPEA